MEEKTKSEHLKTFGAAVRQIRKHNGLSQEGLSTTAGIDRSYLGAIERGECNVALLNIIKISTALGVKPSRLLDGFEIQKKEAQK